MNVVTLPQPHKVIEHPLLVIERILRDREGLWKQIMIEDRLGELIRQMVASSTIALACYGLVLGFSNGPLQALSSAIKLPILFLLTLLICLPTLYLFNLVFGARLLVRQAMALVEQPVNMSLLYIWLMLYGFVGTQLGWTLRPFFGSPNKPFELFRSLDGNFYMNIVDTFTKLLS